VPVPILIKAALPSVPLVNQLPGIRKDPHGDPSTLSFSREVTLERNHVAAYAAVCGFPAKDAVPLTYPHVLAFPLQMSIMTSPEFPFPAIGSVHVENSVTGHRPIFAGETLDLIARAGSPRPHAKGTTVDFTTEVRVGDELVWESTSTYLRRGRGDDSAPSGTTFSEVPPGGVEWRLPADLGRRYAAVSGDGTRSTSTPSPPRRWASRDRSRTACGARRGASRPSRTASPTRSGWTWRSRSRSCCRARCRSGWRGPPTGMPSR